MASKVYPSKDSPIPVPDLYNWNTDREPDVPVMVRGGMYRTSGGSWNYASNPTSFQVSNVSMAVAGTLYSCVLPANTKMFDVDVRGFNGNMLSSTTTGAVSAASDYWTMMDNQSKRLGGVGCDFDSQTIYFEGSANDMILELVIYK